MSQISLPDRRKDVERHGQWVVQVDHRAHLLSGAQQLRADVPSRPGTPHSTARAEFAGSILVGVRHGVVAAAHRPQSPIHDGEPGSSALRGAATLRMEKSRRAPVRFVHLGYTRPKQLSLVVARGDLERRRPLQGAGPRYRTRRAVPAPIQHREERDTSGDGPISPERSIPRMPLLRGGARGCQRRERNGQPVGAGDMNPMTSGDLDTGGRGVNPKQQVLAPRVGMRLGQTHTAAK